MLKEELIRRGYSHSKINTNTDFISDIVSVVSENKDEVNAAKLFYERAEKKLQEAAELENEARKHRAIATQAEYNAKSHDQNAMVSEREAMAAEARIRDIEKRIEQTETPEARDRIRLAHMFDKMTERNTCYDNTEYIKGLSAILAGKELEVAK